VSPTRLSLSLPPSPVTFLRAVARRVAAFLSGVVRKGWTDDLSVRFEIINGLPGLLVIGPSGLVQTTAFEIEDGVVKAIYVVRNPDKLKHLSPA
jgi:RNA polymerase sigma-70 factor, ECF subfamily